MSLTPKDDSNSYEPDHLLTSAYDEATLLNEEGLTALCPSYTELSQVQTRYRDDSPLGQGAIKDVYKTYDNRTKRWVAMARLRADRGAEFYDLFVHEAWLTSSLSHPNIIKIYDAGVDSESRPFFTMDLKGNTTLQNLIRSPEPATLHELLEIFVKVCDAVAYAHSRGIIHLDLKPENIQSDKFGEVLVCDWGLGKVIGATEEGEEAIPASLRPHDNMTLLGQIKGSLGFMAPEQATPGSQKDQRTDVFALGCILHLILTGEAPFTGRPEEILAKTIAGRVTPPHLRFPQRQIPEGLEAVTLKATARLPEERYATVLSLQQEIEKFLGGYSTEAEHPGFFREIRLFVSRNLLPTAITLLALTTVSILSFVYLRNIDHQAFVTNQAQLRADQFKSEASTHLSVLNTHLTETKQSREELAAKLAISAGSLKGLGIFQNPAKTIREVREVTTMALALDPQCAEGRLQHFSLDCLTLNFARALENPPPEHLEFADYLEFAQAFPHFAYTEESRPPVEDLVAFFQGAREINDQHAALMERILSYDISTRTEGASYHLVIISLLGYLNGGDENFSASFDSKNASFTLQSDKNISLRVPAPGGSGRCLLRFLPIRSLKLEIAGPLHLADLHGLPIESLQIQDCPNLQFGSPLSLPLLREIHYRPGQQNPQLLKRWIQSHKNLVFIPVPEDVRSE